jgi:hypothetical protein
MTGTSRLIWEPSRECIESTNVYPFMQRLGFADYRDFIRYSQDRLEELWDKMVRELGIDWFQPYQQVLDASRGVECARWFTGGKLKWVRLLRGEMRSFEAAWRSAVLQGLLRRRSSRSLAVDLPEEADWVYAQGLGNFAEFDNVQPPFAPLVLGDERLRLFQL